MNLIDRLLLSIRAQAHLMTPDDLLTLPVRAQVLADLAERGHRYPWALGSIWSPLTDHQAAHVLAWILGRVERGEPVRGVLGPWTCAGDAGEWPGVTRYERRTVCPGNAIVATYRTGRGRIFGSAWTAGLARGDERGDAGRLASERSARLQGWFLLEEVP